MKWLTTYLRRRLERGILNPWSWLVWAGLLFAAWGFCHVMGWRTDTAIISGTADPEHGSMHDAALRGTMYAVAYLVAVTAGPILVLASGVFGLLMWMTGQRQIATESPAAVQQEAKV